MTGPIRAARHLAAALIAAAIALAVPALAAAAPPGSIVSALRDDGVYVSPRVMGEAAAATRAELVDARAELLSQRREVAMAIVPGPAGSRSLLAFARSLRAAAELDGPLILAAPGRPLAVTGAPAPAAAATALEAARVERIANPADRLVAAAWIVTVPAPEPDGTTEIAILLILGALGGAWAIAWGSHRTDRRRRDRMSDRRNHVRLGLDALRAHATAVADDPSAGTPAHDAAAQVLALCSDTLAGLHEARTEADIVALIPRIRDGFATLASAMPAEREPVSADDPFAGLCRVDPAHGPAAATAPVAGVGEDVPVCPRCARLAEERRPLHPRMVPAGRGAMPFPEAHACLTPTGVPADRPLNA